MEDEKKDSAEQPEENKKAEETSAGENTEEVKTDADASAAATEEVNTEEVKAEETAQAETEKAEETETEETDPKEPQDAEFKPKAGTNPNGPAPVNKPKKKHSFNWAMFGKICAVGLFAFACGFGGGYAAYKVNQDNEEDVTQFSGGHSFQMPSQGDSGSSSSGDSSSDSPFDSSAVLGITVQQKSSTDSSTTEVVVVAINENGYADDAGLEVGDVITKVDDEDVTSVSGLSEYISSLSVGDTVTLTYERDGEEGTAEVELVDSTSISEDNNAA